MVKNKSALIVGGGYTGISAAVHLIDKGYKVHLIEISDKLGGLGKTIKLSNNFYCEAFYHHYFIKDKFLLDFINRFLEIKPTYKSTKMSIFHKNQHHNWNGLFDLFLYPHITFICKLRFIISTILLSKGYLKDKALDKYSLSKGMQKLFGKKAFNSIWGPILNGKFGNKVNTIPLRWMAGRLKQRLESRKLGNEKLGYLKGSLNKLTEKIVKFINFSKGSRIYKNAKISNIKLNKKNKKYTVELKNKNNQIINLNLIDKLIFTIDQNASTEILKEYSLVENLRVPSHNYFTAYCVLLELKESLSNSYWTNIADESIYFCGYIEQTKLTGIEEYGNIYLGYLTKYLFIDKNEKVLSKVELEKLAYESLNKLFPNREIKSIVQKIHISISHKAQLITDFDFCETKMDYFKNKNIFLGNMSNVYPDERSINNAIKVGYELSNIIN